MPGKLWEWSNYISFYATLHQFLLLLLCFTSSVCLYSTVLKTDKQRKNRGTDFQLPGAGRGVREEGGLNWKRWPQAALEGRVASSEHSKLQRTIWTLRPWVLRFSTGPNTGCKRTECSICAQPSTQRRGATGIGVTWFIGQDLVIRLLESAV